MGLEEHNPSGGQTESPFLSDSNAQVNALRQKWLLGRVVGGCLFQSSISTTEYQLASTSCVISRLLGVLQVKAATYFFSLPTRQK